ncbi:MAG TPA: MFS transporter [Polyangia bacterium]|nr:MFS transporter [Polyangia bacterium]
MSGAGGSGVPADGAAQRATNSRATTVIAAGLIVTALGWPMTLARLPFGLYLKNQLGVSPQQLALFWAGSAAVWAGKPLAGFLCDSVPLFGSRRRSYLVAGSVASGALWATMAVVPRSYGALLAVAIALNAALLMVSAAVGGFLVEEAQRRAATGRLSGLRLAIDAVVALGAGPLGGWLALRAFGWTAAVGVVVVLPLGPLAFAWAREPARSRALRATEAWRSALVALRARPVWAVLLFVFVAYLPPGFGTALFFRQQDALKMDARTMGFLQMLGGGGALVGAAIYAWLCRRFSLRALLLVGIALNVASTLAYVGYDGLRSAELITVAAALVGPLALLPYYDLAARVVPRDSESFGYALILGAQNLASIVVAEPAGAYLFGALHVSFERLVLINTVCTAAVFLFVPLLPAALLAGRDA